MKYFSTIIITMLCLNSMVSQNIINVNNSGNSVLTDFTDFQEAIDSADVGDILYIYPSGISYGSIVIDKKLTIIGPGYKIVENLADLDIHTFTNDALVDNVTINDNADGIYITSLNIDIFILNDLNNAIIERNYIRHYARVVQCNNIFIQGNFFAKNGDVSGNYCVLNIESGSTNILVRNNIFPGWFNGPHSLSTTWSDNLCTNSGGTATIENNIFRDRADVDNCTIQNNIFLHYASAYSGEHNPIYGTGNSIINNVMVYNDNYGSSTNIVNVNQDSIFIGYTQDNGHSFDKRYQLLPNSPADSAGVGGIDCGVFDGDKPYKLSGLPFIPVVSDIIAPSSGTASGGLNVTIKARAED